MKHKKFENYIYDLGNLIKEMAIDAKQKNDISHVHNYELGYLMALHDIVSLMKQQADAFDIDQKSIGLNDIDPDNDLV